MSGTRPMALPPSLSSVRCADHRRFARTATLTGVTSLLLLCIALLVAPSVVEAKPAKVHAKAAAFAPPKGKLFAGVSDTGQTSDFREYQRQTGAHPAVLQSFESWGYIPTEAVRRWRETRTRGMLSLSTGPCWGCDAVISNESIAEGKGDRYIVDLAKALAEHERPTYIRLLPEMNGYWNPYGAFHGSGERRPDRYSTANFKRAWKRFVLIVRGGKRVEINRRLKRLKMPPISAKTKRSLPRPKVAFAWVPQATGTPNVKGNQPADYFPGYAFVDWVGADVYGKFPSLQGLQSLYRKHPKAPFMIGEWSPWNRDDPGFVESMLRWVSKHGRTKLVVYYQGFGERSVNEFEISDYPKSQKTLKRRLNSKRFTPFAPEFRKKRGKR